MKNTRSRFTATAPLAGICGDDGPLVLRKRAASQEDLDGPLFGPADPTLAEERLHTGFTLSDVQ